MIRVIMVKLDNMNQELKAIILECKVYLQERRRMKARVYDLRSLNEHILKPSRT